MLHFHNDWLYITDIHKIFQFMKYWIIQKVYNISWHIYCISWQLYGPMVCRPWEFGKWNLGNISIFSYTTGLYPVLWKSKLHALGKFRGGGGLLLLFDKYIELGLSPSVVYKYSRAGAWQDIHCILYFVHSYVAPCRLWWLSTQVSGMSSSQWLKIWRMKTSTYLNEHLHQLQG